MTLEELTRKLDELDHTSAEYERLHALWERAMDHHVGAYSFTGEGKAKGVRHLDLPLAARNRVDSWEAL